MSNGNTSNSEDATIEETPGDVLTDLPEESATDAVGDLAGLFRDGVIGAIAGGAGSVMLSAVLFVALQLNAFETQAFGGLAALIGLEGNLLAGYVLFFGGGMTTWPLLFVSLQKYLPGWTMPLRGVSFATITWTGFVLAFHTGESGVYLALYVMFTLVAHWAYGFTLGAVFAYFIERVDMLVASETR